MKARADVNRITRAKDYELMKLIESSGKSVDGVFEYHEGLSDQTLAAKAGVPFHVIRLRRQQIFGKLKKPGNPANWLKPFMDETKREIDNLKTENRDIQARLAKLEGSHYLRHLNKTSS